MHSHTQVGIIGAGPAGLLLALQLQQEGINSVVFERRSRTDIETTIRAGVLEQGTVAMMNALGIGERMLREGSEQRAIELRFDSACHRIDLQQLTGRALWCYPQHELLKDAAAAYINRGGILLFEVTDVQLSQLNSSQPTIWFQQKQKRMVMQCDFIVGCDGAHGISQTSIPVTQKQHFMRSYPFSWLGTLVACPRSSQDLLYIHHPQGFSLISTRTSTLQRMYVQCDATDTIGQWSDERILEALQQRSAMTGSFHLQLGPIVQKSILAMRSLVTEPMQYGRLFLAGDAAHIVPPTGAKGLNLAAADVFYLGHALVLFYRDGQSDQLDSYSRTCLERIWRVEYFSWWMTHLFHLSPDADLFEQRLQRIQFEQLVTSHSALSVFAEAYVGAPLML